MPADPQAMAKIASGSGGKSFTATTGNELNSVYDQIRKIVGYDTVRTDLTEWFIGLGAPARACSPRAPRSCGCSASRRRDGTAGMTRRWRRSRSRSRSRSSGTPTPTLADRAAAYEDAVLPLLADHGARVVYRGRRVARSRTRRCRSRCTCCGSRTGPRSTAISPTSAAPRCSTQFGEVFTAKEVVELDVGSEAGRRTMLDATTQRMTKSSRFGLAGPRPVVDEAPRAQHVDPARRRS